jgi:hypothetical protein
MKIISGMHRSGTSLVARIFYESGADMGDPETFYRPDKWNPDGYFEQPDIHAINMPLINGPWWKFSYFHLPSTKKILARAAKRAEQIRAASAKYTGRVVKETRFCLTLSAWIRYGAEIEGMLVCLRDPIQVARSLQKRNSISIRRGLNLWYLHNIRLLEQAADLPAWYVYYDNLLAEEKFYKEMGSALRFFGYDLPPDRMEAIRRKCVKPQMNHNAGKADFYPQKITALWEKLFESHNAQFE